MKTIEVPDLVYEILSEVAKRSDTSSIATYLEGLRDVQLGMRTRMLRPFAEKLEATDMSHMDFCDRFLACVTVLYEIDAKEFSKLDGYTKPAGQVIFISSSVDKIRRTSSSTNPKPIGKSGLYLNAQGSQADIVRITEDLCHELSAGITILAIMKKKLEQPYIDPFLAALGLPTSRSK